jgi:hypothetical protein
MITFKEWMKIKEAGAGVPYVGQPCGPDCSFQGANPKNGEPFPLKSVGNVKMKKKSSK